MLDMFYYMLVKSDTHTHTHGARTLEHCQSVELMAAKIVLIDTCSINFSVAIDGGVHCTVHAIPMVFSLSLSLCRSLHFVYVKMHVLCAIHTIFSMLKCGRVDTVYGPNGRLAIKENVRNCRVLARVSSNAYIDQQ